MVCASRSDHFCAFGSSQNLRVFFVSVFLSVNVIIEYPFKVFIDMLNLKTTDLEKYLNSKKKEKKWVCLLGCLPFSWIKPSTNEHFIKPLHHNYFKLMCLIKFCDLCWVSDTYESGKSDQRNLCIWIPKMLAKFSDSGLNKILKS